ncbi:DUF1616 domain-containing protein, partial [Dehalococcoidia bacterium]|nr:DUF1616 domain-containing protein [Dehalococcoidia bacterium]
MGIKIQNELLVINFLSVVLILTISFFPIQVLRIILGLPFILFLPGYTLIAALFPKKSGLDTGERVALSFGLSIAVVPLIGLVLNYTPWGIRLYPILLSLTFFIAAMSVIGWYRRRRLPEQEKLNLILNLSLQESRLDRALSIVLILAVVGAIGTLAHVIASPRVGERFTEFYILGPEGKAEGYPAELTVGEEGQVILGITNREHEIMGYEIKIKVDGILERRIGPVELAHKEGWQEEVGFVLQEPGEDQKVQFILYKVRRLEGEDGDWTELTLWLGRERLSTRTVNLGQDEATYEIKVRVGEGQESQVQSIGTVVLASGEEWKQEVDFDFEAGTQITQFSLYRDGQLLYKEKVSGDYPTLHLWIDV